MAISNEIYQDALKLTTSPLTVTPQVRRQRIISVYPTQLQAAVRSFPIPMNDLMKGLNMRNPKNTRLPQGFMTELGKRVAAILMGKEWRPEYNDATVKQSFAAFFNAVSESNFKKQMEKNRILEDLTLAFALNAAQKHSKSNELEDHARRLILDRNLALFIRLVLIVLEDHDWARGRPELTSDLRNMESRLLELTPTVEEIDTSGLPHDHSEEKDEGIVPRGTLDDSETSADVFPGVNKWLYLDIGRKLRGPWSDRQMYEWYAAGVLPDELQVGELEETDSSPVSQFIGRIQRSRVPESTNLKDMPSGLVNIAPKKTARTPNPEA